MSNQQLRIIILVNQFDLKEEEKIDPQTRISNRNNYPFVFNEIWSPITTDVVPDILPYYHISTYGRIYSAIKEDMIILSIDRDGYVIANFHVSKESPTVQNRLRNQITQRVNRIVLATFKPVDNWKDLCCNHKDSIRSNNYIENLEWVTPKENYQHGLDYGYIWPQDIEGERNPKAKLTTKQVLEIVDLLNKNELNYTAIGELYGVSGTVIRDIARGVHWSSVTEGLISKDIIRVSRAYSNSEVKMILDFFESKKDVLNDKSVYRSMNAIVEDCMISTGLINTHSIEASRKSIVSYLRKTNSSAKDLYPNYTYQYNS